MPIKKLAFKIVVPAGTSIEILSMVTLKVGGAVFLISSAIIQVKKT